MRYFNMIKPYLSKNGIVVFDDINWSSQMRKAWKDIKKDKQVTMSIDLFFMGIVFVNKNLSKQDFIVRF